MVDIDDSIIEIHRYGEEGSVRTTRVNGAAANPDGE